jgi:hypothetical protein
MPGGTETAAARVRECMRRLQAREADMREWRPVADDEAMPDPSMEDVERTVAWLDAKEELDQAVEAFRDSVLPPDTP